MSGENMSHRAIKCLLLLCLTLDLPCLLAATSDRNQPINIEADSVRIDDVNGVSVYKGNVIYQQGTINLHADKVTIFTEAKKLKKFIAEGTPVKYQQQFDGQAEVTRSESQKIEYFSESEQLVFHGNAHLWHDNNTFSGNVIEFDIKNDLVNARKSTSGEERVQVIIQPKDESDLNQEIKPTH